MAKFKKWADTSGVISPVVDMNFDAFSNTAGLLADSRWVNGGLNTGTIALDSSVGYAPLGRTKSMRYDFADQSGSGCTPNLCCDYAMHPGFLSVPGALTEVWAECGVLWKSNFTVSAGTGSCGAEYKQWAAGYIEGGSGRWNGPEMQAAQWVGGWPGNDSGLTNSSAPVPSTFWDGNPHTFRWHMKLSASSAGIYVLQVDNATILSGSSFTSDPSHVAIDVLSTGLNMNQGPDFSGMQMWWLFMRAYAVDPGWGI